MLVLLFTSHLGAWVADDETPCSDLPDRADVTRCLVPLLRSLAAMAEGKRVMVENLLH